MRCLELSSVTIKYNMTVFHFWIIAGEKPESLFAVINRREVKAHAVSNGPEKRQKHINI